MKSKISFSFLLSVFPLLLINCSSTIKDHSMYKHKIYLKAYPEHISHITDTAIVWKDGTKMLVSDGRKNQKTFFEKLNDASLLDQISLPYIAGPNYIDTVKQKDFDPGRITNFAFFLKCMDTQRKR